jgi:hypothetical protein
MATTRALPPHVGRFECVLGASRVERLSDRQRVLRMMCGSEEVDALLPVVISGTEVAGALDTPRKD